MRRLAVIVILLTASVSAQQINTDIVPASTGLNIGHNNQRWNGFFQVMDISSAMTKLSVANAGVFTNTQMNQYFTSIINGIPLDMYHSIQGFPGFTTEAGTFGIAVPAAAPIGEADSVVGMITSACNSSARTTCNSVAVSGHAEALANGAAVWGQNTTVSNHNAALTGLNLIGNEIDIGLAGNQSGGYVHGLDVFLTPAVGATMPSGINGVGIEVANSTYTAQWFDGLFISGLGINTSGNAIYIDQNCATGAGACNSAKITLVGQDGSNVQHSGSWFTDSNGNIVLTAGATGLGLKLPQSSFANLGGSVVSGVILFCTDCKNVPDNSVTAGAPCVGGGQGAVAKRENNRWDCN